MREGQAQGKARPAERCEAGALRGEPAPIALRRRLGARRSELEQRALSRVRAIADPDRVPDPAYATGLAGALSSALDYGIAAIGTAKPGPTVPAAVLAQARLAARNRISLDTVMRRYFAGYSLLGDFLAEEAERMQIATAGLRELQRDLDPLFDRVLARVGEEYARERDDGPDTTEGRRVDRVRSLLAGDSTGCDGLAYDFDAEHVGLLAVGFEAERPLRSVAARLDARLLIVEPDGQTAWAWLGRRRPLDSAEVRSLLSPSLPGTAALAFGEPAAGLAGWRLTHRQAVAALPAAERSPGGALRYADVALLASIQGDDLLATSLRRMYLEPLEGQRDRGATARETLRAYFAAGRNASSAGTLLGVNRHTVSDRLRAIEERLRCSLDSRAADVEIALRLAEDDRPGTTARGLHRP